VSEFTWPALVPAWDGEAVVVTGVGRAGQAGAVVARAFAMHGATVHCIDRDEAVAERAHELTRDGLRAVAHTADLSDAEGVQQLARRIAAAHGGRIHAVAAIAGGFAASGPIADSDPETYARQTLINATSAWTTARAFVPAVRAAKGAFVFVTSTASLPQGQSAGLAAYAMAKGAIVPLVQALAQEEAEHGVRVNAVAPTALRTAANSDAMGSDRDYVEREEFATTILALCSPAWRRVSGQVIGLA
jgi:3-oxoacyl-[acyl-carrier protein] reductase